MNGSNLLPAHHRTTKRRRRAVRRWVVVNSVYAVLLAVAGGVYAWDNSTHNEPSAVDSDLVKLNATLASVRQQSAGLGATLRSVLDVTVRPDWSILLAVLAESLGDDVVLISIDTAIPGGRDGTPAEPNRFTLNGVGRSQAAVTQFVLRVESLDLFAQVRLAQTSPQSVRGSEGVGFQLICTLPRGGQ